MSRKRAAPPPREPAADDRIGAGHHPYYIIYEDGSWAVVRTFHGLHPQVVEGGFVKPKTAIERANALNAGG